MCGAIHAHKKLHECAGILHGDINPNTIVALDTEDGKVEGALIDYDMPMCRAAMRKLAKPDPVVPPPAPPRQFYMPAYYH
uniref:N/A n=1 Tax=Ganoderma boninense TaxID=34458 RepID=A0A5K1JX30_9APHY|nr:N/A [Ganoderma boninense]